MEHKELLEAVVNELLDEVSLGLCFEIHRSCKLGTFLLDEMDSESQRLYEIVNNKGLDVFGQVPTAKKQYDCICPNCYRNMAASRFAPHLEKCMGMGGSVPRVASRRIASSQKKSSDIESDDNSRDNDWTYQTHRKVKKAKKDKRQATPKKSKILQKPGKGSGSGVIVIGDSGATINFYDAMSVNEKRSLLRKTCGVISEHTKKMCTRSINCPQHTDDQRKVVRDLLLEPDLSYDTEASLGSDFKSVSQSVNIDSAFTPSSSETSSPNKVGSIIVKRKKSKKSHISRRHLIAPVTKSSQNFNHADPD